MIGGVEGISKSVNISEPMVNLYERNVDFKHERWMYKDEHIENCTHLEQ